MQNGGERYLLFFFFGLQNGKKLDLHVQPQYTFLIFVFVFQGNSAATKTTA